MKVKPALLFSCLSAMALSDYTIAVFICGHVRWVGGVMGDGEEGRMVGEEIRMVGEVMRMRGVEGEDAAGYR